MATGLPGNGPAITYDIMRIINVLTDGIVAVIVVSPEATPKTTPLITVATDSSALDQTTS